MVKIALGETPSGFHKTNIIFKDIYLIKPQAISAMFNDKDKVVALLEHIIYETMVNRKEYDIIKDLSVSINDTDFIDGISSLSTLQYLLSLSLFILDSCYKDFDNQLANIIENIRPLKEDPNYLSHFSNEKHTLSIRLDSRPKFKNIILSLIDLHIYATDIKSSLFLKTPSVDNLSIIWQ